MKSEAYYPPLLNKIKINENKYNSLIMKCLTEISRLDGMLTYTQHGSAVKAFLTAEEVLASASLEVKELSFHEYLQELLEKGYESDDMVEMRFMLNYYPEARKTITKRGFSLSFLNQFNQNLVDNRNIRRLSAKEMYRKRHPWLVQKTDKFDERLYLQADPTRIKQLMDNLDAFIRKNEFHPLVTAAIAYGQLIMIHPWRYANGRTTGALIPFMFNFIGLTTARSFYVSSIFSKKKEEYYNQLNELFQNINWNTWLEYFLENLTKQAIASQKKVYYIIQFYDWFLDHSRLNISNHKNICFYLDILLTHPIFMPTELERSHGLSRGILSKYIYYYRDMGLLDKDDRTKYQNYIFSKLYSLFEI